jgi:hypothetical protein
VPRRRQRPTGRELGSERDTGRLNRRSRVMEAFNARPGEPLETDQLAAATHLPPSLARSIAVDLEASGWLQPARSGRGHVAWRRPSDSGDPPTVAASATPTPLARPGNAHYCRRCSSTGDGPVPPAGWLRLQRRSTRERDSWPTWQTLGVYCGTACLVAEMAGQEAKAQTP